MYKIFVINVGSTSTKVAYYVDRECKLKTNLEHDARELLNFGDVLFQRDYRKKKILDYMEQNGIKLEELDAITSRGGHTRPIEGGVYRINELMLAEIKTGKFGRHACDLGPGIAYELVKGIKALALVVDPPVTDEYENIARYSGSPLMPRQSRFHALNHKATAKRYARDNGLDYHNLNLISVHMGGGISVAAHRKGRIIDATNGIDGEGPFSTNRTGSLTAKYLADLCFSGIYTQDQIHKLINGGGGLVAYLNETDVRKCEEKAAHDPYTSEVLDAMMYQIAKEVGAYSAVLKGKIDAVLLTGGISYSKYLMTKLIDSISYLGKIVIYPGENEMEALAFGAYDVLAKEERIKSLE